jgi:hypothetical protein
LKVYFLLPSVSRKYRKYIAVNIINYKLNTDLKFISKGSLN